MAPGTALENRWAEMYVEGEEEGRIKKKERKSALVWEDERNEEGEEQMEETSTVKKNKAVKTDTGDTEKFTNLELKVGFRI